MDTAERTTVDPPAGSSTYDGFISYSHAADDLLAPRLQAGLQRFAKPWWKRRAVRIFRDESSLAANPHLWSSITDALDDSSWFVLLLSEDAASSEWVGKEIEHWIDHKPSDRILPVVTDGTFGWENGDVTGSSVPPALHGVFTEEPRWVDLRFARGEEQLDLQNPDFSAAVADIAATIRGVPKDELASEEVKQHRRTVRTAWAAGIALLVLAVAAIVAGVFAIGQRNDARDAQDLAEQNAQIAEQNAAAEAEAREDADANRLLAEQNAVAAEANAQLAEARELAASAVNVLESNPELATLLAIEAIDSTDDRDQPVEVINALWRAGHENRHIGVIEHGFGGKTHVALSNDTDRLFVTSEEGATAQMYDARSLELLWEYSENTLDSFTFPSITEDGSRVAIGITDSDSLAAVRDVTGDDGLPTRIVVLDGDTGALIESLEYPQCAGVEQNEFSPDGRFLVTGSGFEGCPRDGVLHWLEVYETKSWTPVAFLPVPDLIQLGGPIPRFDDSGKLFLFGANLTDIYAAETFQSSGTVLGSRDSIGDVTPDGTAIALASGASVSIHDSASGETRDLLGSVGPVAIPLGLSITDDGRFVVAGTKGRYTSVFDLATGEQMFRLPGGQVNNTGYHIADEQLFTAHDDGTVKVWDLSQRAVGIDAIGDLAAATWVNGNSFAIGPEYGAFVAIDIDTFTWYLRFFDLQDGTLLEASTNGYTVEALDDGRYVHESVAGPWAFFDPRTGVEEPFLGCAIGEDGTCADTGEPPIRYFVLISPDQREMVAIPSTNGVATDGTLLRLDLQTGAVVGEESIPSGFLFAASVGADWIMMGRSDQLVALDRATGEELWFGTAPGQTEISPSGKNLVFRTQGTGLTIVELGSWAETTVEGDFGNVRGMSFSPDETKIALGNEDGILVFDLVELATAQVVPITGVSDMYWLDDETLSIGTNTGVWGKVSLNTDDFLADTRAGLRRAFTTQECVTYGIDSCPTLEEIKAR